MVIQYSSNSREINMNLHTNPRILSILLIFFLTGFCLLGISALMQFDHPLEHYIDLLMHDRVVQMIMFDFLFVFIWVFLWMIDQEKPFRRYVFRWILIGMIAATLMIYLFILLDRRKPRPGENL